MNLIKEKVNKIIEHNAHITLDLGCGGSKKQPDYIGIDILEAEGVDIVGDIYAVLSEFPENSVDAVYASHFFEHVLDVPKLLLEIERIMKSSGTLKIIVPHFSNPYFYSDPTHKSFWGLYTMSYLCNNELLTRKVPNYKNRCNLDVSNIKLGFKSSSSFPVRYGLKLAIGSIFNLTTWLKEFYEENLCYFISCYEISYDLVKK